MTSRLRVLIAALVVCMAGAAAQAQLSMTWFTIDGGGGTSTGGALSLSFTVGQPDAGPVMTGGSYTFTGGFWVGGNTGSHCGSADFNCDGDIGTDADIESFFACLAGTCPPPPCTNSADFNGDGDIGTDADIEAFFRVLAGGTC